MARQSLIAATVPNHFRGTATSTLGGTVRLVAVAGPLLGGCTPNELLLLHPLQTALLHPLTGCAAIYTPHYTSCCYTPYRLIVGAYGVAAAFWTQALIAGLTAALVAVVVARPSVEALGLAYIT